MHILVAFVTNSPEIKADIQQLEKVQRRAARWVLNDFSRYSSITNMLQQLSWPSLQVRRKICRLQTLFKIIHNEYPLSIPSYYLEMERATRQDVTFFLLHPPTYSSIVFISDQFVIGTLYHPD